MRKRKPKNLSNDLSIVWFSQILDYQSLSSSIYASKSVFGDSAKYIVNLDDEEKIYLDIESVDFNHSAFDQNKKTGGLNRIIGEIKTFEKVYESTGNKLLLKQDSDVICLNRSFLNYIDGKHTFYGQVASQDKNPYGYGAAYVIDCSKLNFSNVEERLLQLDERLDNLFSKKGWPEDLTIHYFCKEHGDTLLLDKNNNPRWMYFVHYDDEYLLSMIRSFFSEDYPIDWDYFNSSFVNCGYGFQDIEVRDIMMKMLCFKSSQDNNFDEVETVTEVKDTIIEFPV